MKHTKPMRQTDTQRWQPPVRPGEERQETNGSVGKRLPWLVGVSPEPGRIPAAIILPARFFLAITYLYAGIQKFTDPQFFSPTAPGFIGEQMQGYIRAGSPLSPLLTFLVIPHAAAFGALIAFCELLIGISALIGLLTRGGAIAGLALSLIFYLTASWAVHPYFLGGDLPYALLWLTLALAGPGSYSLDEYFFGPILRGRTRTAVLPTGPQPRRASSRSPAPSPQPTLVRHPIPSEAMTRAAVLRGFGTAALLAVGAGIAGVVAKSRTPNQDFTDASASLSTAGAAPPATPTTTAQAAVPTAPVGQAPSAAIPAPTSPPAEGATPVAPSGTTFLGSVASLTVNSAARFTDPGSGDPAVLIHLPSGQFVAYDAVCTHAGCTVGYSSSRQMLVCPCHGAVFDPAHGARGVSGPSRTPLTTLQVQVDAQGNAYVKSA